MAWPTEAIEFLRELEDNNDRDWFKANRARYDAALAAPAKALGERLEADGYGAPKLFRPYNDTRFRPGPPIKEHIGLAVGFAGAGGYYVELSLDGLLVAAGMYMPARDQLARFRAIVDDERRARSFEEAVRAAEAGGLALAAPALKRAPKGYPVDHPRIDRLRLKQMTVSVRHPLEPWIHSEQAPARIGSQLAAARPLVEWLREHIGPTSEAR